MPLDAIVGQDRAVQSLDFGLSLRQPGYNVYVSGTSGTGRKSLIQELLQKRARQEKVPDDWIYVNNFDHPDSPLAIRLPGGQGGKLRKAVVELIDRLHQDLPALIKEKDFGEEKQHLEGQYAGRMEALFQRLTERALELKLLVRQMPKGIITFVPLKEGKALSRSDVDLLSTAEKEDIDRRQEQLANLAADLRGEQQELERQHRHDVQDVVRTFARRRLEPLLLRLKEAFPLPEIARWVERVGEHVLDHLDRLGPQSPSDPNDLPAALRNFLGSGVSGAREEDPLHEYQINLVVDNSATDGAPVVFETSPTYRNLFGAVERDVNLFGHVSTDFTRIKAGSLLRANGGYLILDLGDALTEPLVWKQLKRILKFRQLFTDAYEPLALFSAGGLKPQPIPTDIKVVAVGNLELYHLLRRYDEDFGTLFRVHADCAEDARRDETSHQAYARFIARLVRDERLLPFDAGAVAEVIRHGSREAGHQERLSVEFPHIADLVREASLLAVRAGSPLVGGEHIRHALDAQVYRSGLVAERIREFIAEGTLRVAIQGTRVGEINGLSVINLGDLRFGRPSRVSASVGVGREGVLNIERESDLSGSMHSKGILILEGYLRNRYACVHPLALSASLTFEQSYGWVEGDSASSAELYCLLSAIAQVPLRQDVAVTGSVDQHGEIQAVGGVNEKIEGFFDVCRMGGLSGTQGVCIPKANLHHLVLRPDVVEAVRQGQFHVWAVETVDEGIELLTGMEAGDVSQKDTFHWRLEQRLQDILRALEPLTPSNGHARSGSHPARYHLPHLNTGV